MPRSKDAGHPFGRSFEHTWSGRAARDRSFEQQRYRASGLTLVTAAIALWNTIYIERAVRALDLRGQPVDPALLKYLSPLGWEHINLTGDYQWNGNKPAAGRFRSLRTPNLP